MKYTELFTPHHIAELVDWFAEKPELCVEIYIPYGAGSEEYFTIRSLAELKSLILSITSQQVQITIWKNHSQSELESEEAQPLPEEMKTRYKYVNEVMHFSVTKNRNRTESYVNHPDRYAKFVEEWNA